MKGIPVNMKGMGGGMPKGNKAAPRGGAAKGQGGGLGGYNAGAVNKGFSEVKGSGGKPSYHIGNSSMANAKPMR